MGSTFYSLHVHIVFSTKNRAPWITEDRIKRLHQYMGGAINGSGCVAEQIGGVDDHIHILASFKPSICLSDVIRELKKQTNAWFREEFEPEFAWQDGYAAFSVGPKGVENVRRYILGQPEHHKKFSYLYELKKLLEEAGIPYDERFLA